MKALNLYPDAYWQDCWLLPVDAGSTIQQAHQWPIVYFQYFLLGPVMPYLTHSYFLTNSKIDQYKLISQDSE